MFSSFNNNMFEFSDSVVTASSPFDNLFDKDPKEKEKQRLKGRRVPTESYETPVTRMSKNVQLRQTGCDRDRPVYGHTAGHVQSTLQKFCQSKNPYSEPSGSSSTGGSLRLAHKVPSTRMRKLLQRVSGSEVVQVDGEDTVLQGGCTNPGQSSLLSCDIDEAGTAVVQGLAAGADNYVEYTVDESQPFGERHSLVEPVVCCDPTSFDGEGSKRCLNRDFMDVRSEVLSHQADAATLKSSVRLGESGKPQYVFENVQDPRKIAECLNLVAEYSPPRRDTLDSFVHGECGSCRDDISSCAGERLVRSMRHKSLVRTVANTGIILLVCVVLATALFFVFRAIMVRSTNPNPSDSMRSALQRPPSPVLVAVKPVAEAVAAPPRSRVSAHTTGSIVQSLRKRIDDLLQTE